MTVKKIAGISISALAAFMFATTAVAHDGDNVATGHKDGKVVDRWGNCIISKSGNDLCSPPPPEPEPPKVVKQCKNIKKCTPVNITMNKSLAGDTTFGFNKDFLTAAGEAELSRLANSLRGVSVRSISIIGHTDACGSDSYNQGLSERRAATVANFLVANGINGAVISAQGMGETQAKKVPCKSYTDAERESDRRVDIRIAGTASGGTKQNCTTQQVCKDVVVPAAK
ncbi:MAG TPA: OmpA family protein [Thiothrix sp.]|nr:OmpA family protein [Thiothrix sp.]